MGAPPAQTGRQQLRPACAHPLPRLCPARRLCPDGQAPALLESSTNGQCTYAKCGDASALDGQAQGVANAAAMAAPAVVLTLVVVAFVEILMHFC